MTNPNRWVEDLSSGFAGFRCTDCGTWVFDTYTRRCQCDQPKFTAGDLARCKRDMKGTGEQAWLARHIYLITTDDVSFYNEHYDDFTPIVRVIVFLANRVGSLYAYLLHPRKHNINITDLNTTKIQDAPGFEAFYVTYETHEKELVVANPVGISKLVTAFPEFLHLPEDVNLGNL